MTFPAGYRVRLRVRLAMALKSSDTSRAITLAGRVVNIASQTAGQPISEALWIILSSGGSSCEETAREFGMQLRIIVELAGLCSRLGIDVGLDQRTDWMNEVWAKSSGLIEADQRLLPNIHGLMVHPDDGKSRFFLSHAEGRGTLDPEHFEGALAELAAELPFQIGSTAAGVRLLNLALVNPQPLAQIVLALSAVEALGQDETWTDIQTALIQELATDLKTRSVLEGSEVAEVADAIRRSLHRIGLRQGVLRILDRLKLLHLKNEWDRVYGLRSGVLHGIVRLPDEGLSKLSIDAITLCGCIILKQVQQGGLQLPAISFVKFGIT